MTLLEVKDLSVVYQTRKGFITALNNISFELNRGNTLGLVGESGCGKSTLGMALMRLLPGNASIIKGNLFFENQDLLKLTDDEIRQIRWKKISMIFQAAMNALNPVHRVADQIMEAITTHNSSLLRESAIKQTEKLFDLVNIPKRRMTEYPHQYSGGMKQRAVIAMALACRPSLIIADEPTTALDVILQSQILESIKLFQKKLNLAILFISHDIAVVADICHDICVMYAGELIEYGAKEKVLGAPVHPYTKTLISSYLTLIRDLRPLKPVQDSTTSHISNPDLCCFLNYCPNSEKICRNQKPVWVELAPDHRVFCLLANKIYNG